MVSAVTITWDDDGGGRYRGGSAVVDHPGHPDHRYTYAWSLRTHNADNSGAIITPITAGDLILSDTSTSLRLVWSQRTTRSCDRLEEFGDQLELRILDSGDNVLLHRLLWSAPHPSVSASVDDLAEEPPTPPAARLE